MSRKEHFKDFKDQTWELPVCRGHGNWEDADKQTDGSKYESMTVKCGHTEIIGDLGKSTCKGFRENQRNGK